MTQHELIVDQTKRHVEQAARHPWVEKMARFGFATKGIVYVLIGVLAAMAAFGAGGATTNQQGIIRWIAGLPFGKLLLGAITIGLIGYALWKLVEAIVDPANEGNEAKGIIKRLGDVISAVIYGGFALVALRTLLGAAQNNGSSTQSWTARLLGAPFGQWLVGLVGAIIIGYGLYQIYQGYGGTFRKKLNLGQMSATEQTWALRSGRWGLIARGIVFGIIGGLLIQAARSSDAGRAAGIDGALQTLAQQGPGPWLLGIVAIGLAAYGVFMLVRAVRRDRKSVTITIHVRADARGSLRVVPPLYA